MGILVAAMLIVAVRDRFSQLAFAASVTSVYSIGLCVLLPVLAKGEALTAEVTVSWIVWSACGLGAFSLLWLALSRWIDGDHLSEGSAWLKWQLAIMTVFTLAIPAWSAVDFLATPAASGSFHSGLGGWPTYVAVALTWLALAWYLRRYGQSVADLLLAPAVLTLCIVVSSSIQGIAAQPG